MSAFRPKKFVDMRPVYRNDEQHISYLGMDPEFFVRDGAGKYVGAYHYFPTSQTSRSVDAHIFFRDGWALEINPHKNTCREVLQQYINTVLWAALRALPSDHTLVATSAVPIDLEDLRDAPTDCLTFGCKPSLNAYTGGVPGVVDLDAAEHPFRYAGGHIHHSFLPRRERVWQSEHEKLLLVPQYWDKYVALPLTYLVGGEATAQRRQHYGKAGEFRIQKYPNGCGGMEYRTPGPEMYAAPWLLTMALGASRVVWEDFEWFLEYRPLKHQDQVRAAVNRGLPDEGLLDLIDPIPWLYDQKILYGARNHTSKLSLDVRHVLTEYNWEGGALSSWRYFVEDSLGISLADTIRPRYDGNEYPNEEDDGWYDPDDDFDDDLGPLYIQDEERRAV